MDLREQNFGIEIETINRTRQQVASAIRSVVGGNISQTFDAYDTFVVTDSRNRKWKVVRDSSLSAPRDKQAEIVSPILRYEDIPELQNVVRAVRKAGAKVNQSCGIHVHVDSQPFTGKTLTNLAKLVYKQEALMFHALDVNLSRRNRFAKPLSETFIRKLEEQKPRTREEFNAIWYGYQNNRPAHYDRTRYHGLNLHNVFYRNTLEFRYFESTLHAGKVKSCVQLALAIAAKALNSRSASSKKRAFRPASAKYDFRCWLLRLGLIGDEFKTARLHLLKRMPGDASFKNGRPQRQTL